MRPRQDKRIRDLQASRYRATMRLFLVAAIAIILVACTPEREGPTAQRMALVQLGEKLFVDKALSSDKKVSCATCHVSDHFFAEGKPVSVGTEGRRGTRNAPSLLDIAQVSSFFWDGRESHLENVVTQPLTNPMEMGLPNTKVALRHINRDETYIALSKAAFNKEVLEIGDVGMAISAYLRVLPLQKTRYERYIESGQRSGLNEDEIQGLSLFNGKAACDECHRTKGEFATLTDNRYHHTGVGFERVAGNVNSLIRKLDQAQQHGEPLGTVLLSNPDIAELGRFAVTRRPQDLGAFRTPSLRNVAFTAPYMHDGSIPTLQAAVEREIYYRSLARGRPITLTVEEQRQLISFLQALSASPQSANPTQTLK